MKKLIFLLCVLILLTSTNILFACSKQSEDNITPPTSPQPSTHTCEANIEITYHEQDGKLLIGYPCKTCNKIFQPISELVADLIVKPTDYNVDSLLSSIQSGDIVIFKSGKHVSHIQSPLNGVSVYGESGTILNGLKYGNFTNVIFENIEFESSTELKNNINGITFKKCKFSYGVLCEYPIKNITFESCDFIDIVSTKETAIRLYNYENLTVKNCLFENIAYNALQVGNATGNCYIYGNTFKDIKSRILYLIYVENLASCIIENNIFYDHHDNHVPDESYDEMGCKKETGVYIHTKSSSGVINIGVNTWENIPTYSVEFITPIANYNYSEQIQLL